MTTHQRSGQPFHLLRGAHALLREQMGEIADRLCMPPASFRAVVAGDPLVQRVLSVNDMIDIVRRETGITVLLSKPDGTPASKEENERVYGELFAGGRRH